MFLGSEVRENLNTQERLHTRIMKSLTRSKAPDTSDLPPNPAFKNFPISDPDLALFMSPLMRQCKYKQRIGMKKGGHPFE